MRMLMVVMLGAALGAMQAAAGDWRALDAHRNEEVVVVHGKLQKSEGQLREVTDTRLVLATGSGEMAVAREEVMRVSTRAKSNRTRNMLIGLAAGVGGGLALDAGLGTRLRNEGKGENVRALYYALPAAAGAGIGAAVGGPVTVYRK